MKDWTLEFAVSGASLRDRTGEGIRVQQPTEEE